MAENTCPCGAPTDAYACTTCAGRARQLLATIHDVVIPGPTEQRNGATVQTGPDQIVPGLATDLDVAITRAARFNTPTGTRGSSETPLPFNATASEAKDVLRHTLAIWAGHTANTLAEAHPAYTLYGLAEYLETRLDWITHQPAGPDALDEITAAVRNANRAVDRPADRAYAGPCDVDQCDGELFAYDGSTIAKCTTCRTQTALADRQDELLTRAHDLLLGATGLARLLASLGHHVAAGTIRVWADRGRLTPRPGPSGPVYQVGDVLVLIARAENRRTKAGAA